MPAPSSRLASRTRRMGTSNRLQTSGVLALAVASVAQALAFTPAPAANLDLSQLGRIGVAGDFTGISLYQYEEQAKDGVTTNGLESLLAQLPNGALSSVALTDASIHAMCSFKSEDNSVSGVVIGGNFTSLDGTQSQAIALFNPGTAEITPWSGLSGQVNALLCDPDTDAVYVGGNFIGANSTNAIKWVGSDGWTNLPFAGFNGPVTSITKAPNGHILFGGSFTGLGNASAPSTPDGQIINLSTANISSGSTAKTAGFGDPRSVVCSSGQDGAGSTWLVQDNSPGFWRADFGFRFEPTKLRLYNTHQDGRGAKTWRFTAFPLGGILNFTYTAPGTQDNFTCTSECPLGDDPTVEFQDFHFVNNVGMNAFQIDISDFYGAGAGLNKIELYSDDIFSYAVNSFNEPGAACAGSDFPSSATTTGRWAQLASAQSASQYLTAQLSGNITPDSASVTFFPDIREAGNYSVNIYTPGCLQDGTCSSRRRVNITGVMTSNSNGFDFSTSIFQTNDFEKYDQIYFGYVDAAASDFRPSVTITPLADQNIQNMTFVAQRVGFTLINSTGGLNGLFDFDPKRTAIDTSSFAESAINKLGMGFSARSAVAALTTSGDVTYVGGNFTSDSAQNIVSVNIANGKIQALDGGLNGEVSSMHLDGTKLFVGGRFTNTLKNQVTGLNNVGVYDTEANSWRALGGGVNGNVMHVVPMIISLDGGNSNETVVALSGDFTELVEFDNTEATAVDGFGIWVPSQSDWLQNLNGTIPYYDGILTASLRGLFSGDILYAGSLASAQVAARGAVAVSDGSFSRFGINMLMAPNTTGRLVRPGIEEARNASGVVTGTFFEHDGRVSTVLAGHFSARDSSNGLIQNLAIIAEGDGVSVTGLGPGVSDDSTFVAVDVYGTTLFAGGQVSGQVGQSNIVGLVSYDLSSQNFNAQPPALGPSNSTVSAIAVQRSTGDVYVGGSFERAGPLGCPGVCFYSTSVSQWNRPGGNLDGESSCLLWVSNTRLVAGGSLRINGTVEASLATYNTGGQVWDTFPGSGSLPGPVSAMTAGTDDGSQLWVSGSDNGSVFVSKYNGWTWLSAPSLGAGTVVQSLQVFTVTKDHASRDLLNADQVLMLTGSIVISENVTTPAAIFDGSKYVPYAIASGISNQRGTISKIFVQTDNFFKPGGGNMPAGFVVLVGLAISLGILLLIIAAGILIDRIRKRREGYTPAPTSMVDRGNGMRRIPPHELFGSLGKNPFTAPHV